MIITFCLRAEISFLGKFVPEKQNLLKLKLEIYIKSNILEKGTDTFFSCSGAEIRFLGKFARNAQDYMKINT